MNEIPDQLGYYWLIDTKLLPLKLLPLEHHITYVIWRIMRMEIRGPIGQRWSSLLAHPHPKFDPCISLYKVVCSSYPVNSVSISISTNWIWNGINNLNRVANCLHPHRVSILTLRKGCSRLYNLWCYQPCFLCRLRLCWLCSICISRCGLLNRLCIYYSIFLWKGA